MSPAASRRSVLISYAACVAALAGLMAIVVLSGTTITAKRPVADNPHFAASKP